MAHVWPLGRPPPQGALGGRKATGHHQLNADQLVAADVDPAGFDGPESQGAGREKAGQETVSAEAADAGGSRALASGMNTQWRQAMLPNTRSAVPCGAQPEAGA